MISHVFFWIVFVLTCVDTQAATEEVFGKTPDCGRTGTVAGSILFHWN